MKVHRRHHTRLRAQCEARAASRCPELRQARNAAEDQELRDRDGGR
jgi:hypothetical protein